jgi:hypothetical protein
MGERWQRAGQGCHNPRLDLDNVACDPKVEDPDSAAFCAPENVNIDYPPAGAWFRIAVHYYSNRDLDYDVHPRVKVYCDGALAGELGPRGYFDPEAPVALTADEGARFLGNAFWIVADVALTRSDCGASSCAVRPIYRNAAAKTPLLTDDVSAELSVGPAYPPPP